MTFDEARADFIVRRKGSLGLPITGIIAYSATALLRSLFEALLPNLILTVDSGAIMPIGCAIARLRGEQMAGST